MDKSRVTNALLTERLDAEFYRPSFLENERTLSRLPSKATVEQATSAVKLGYTGPIDDCYSDEGALFLSSKNIAEGRLIIGVDTLRIRHDVHQGKLSSTAAKVGDLLFSRTGSVGKAAVLHDGSDDYNFAAHLIALRPKNGFDADYLSAFFNSCRGRLQSERLQRGTIIQGLSIYDIPGMLVPEYSPQCQKYIGDKVRQAERLRHLEKVIVSQASEFLAANVTTRNGVGQQTAYRSSVNDILSDRLDAAFYDPAHIDLQKTLTARIAKPLGEFVTPVNERWQRNGDEFYYLEIGNLDVSNGRITVTRLPTSTAPSRAQRLVRPWDILVSTVRPNRKNVALAPEISEPLPLVASTGFSVLRCETKEEAAFFHAWLRSDMATQQLVQWNAGGSYPAIDEDVPLRILVPPFSPADIDRMGHRWMLRYTVGVLAESLCDAVKLLVESLIEGHITEVELAEAQRALESGNRDLDRAILARLTLKGFDVADEQPLFPDLDVLYAAIDEASTAAAEGGEG